MLIIHLPNDHPPTGECNINYRQAEYRFGDGTFAFRFRGEPDWDTRRIEGVIPGPALTGYVCCDAEE